MGSGEGPCRGGGVPCSFHLCGHRAPMPLRIEVSSLFLPVLLLPPFPQGPHADSLVPAAVTQGVQLHAGRSGLAGSWTPAPPRGASGAGTSSCPRWPGGSGTRAAAPIPQSSSGLLPQSSCPESPNLPLVRLPDHLGLQGWRGRGGLYLPLSQPSLQVGALPSWALETALGRYGTAACGHRKKAL